MREVFPVPGGPCSRIPSYHIKPSNIRSSNDAAAEGSMDIVPPDDDVIPVPERPVVNGLLLRMKGECCYCCIAVTPVANSSSCL